jgi:UDP-N-acetylmuramoylalanine--D-glutamate ligase
VQVAAVAEAGKLVHMQDAAWKDYFHNKKITVMGVGLLGGVGDIRFLASLGAELIVTDLKTQDQLSEPLAVLAEFPNIRYTLGRHELDDFRGRDLIIQAPATPFDSIYIAEAKQQGTPVSMWAALLSRFAKEMGAKIVGVTGTRGKTTTALLIAHILTHAGRQVIVGGNVQGTSILSRLPEVTPDTIVVLELDSWKLQGFREERLSPDIAVFTTFYPDHLDYYRGDLDRYLRDKAAIFLQQDEHDVLIAGTQVAPLLTGTFGTQIRSKVVHADASSIPDGWVVPILGAHNRYNTGCAVAAVRTLVSDEEVIREAVASFPGVPGRLAFAGEHDGVRFYNDATSTTPEAMIAALRALREEVGRAGKGRVILIAGGADKGLELDAMVAELLRGKEHVLLLAGSGTDRIKDELSEAVVYGSLGEAFTAARAYARAGDAIVLSPGFASFGMFKHEYDRSAQFTALVNALQ